jgi:ABC-type antimicrobial peptide transport system permease subunit
VNFGFKDILIRSDLNPAQIEESVRHELQMMDSTLPLAEAETMTDFMEGQAWDKRVTAIVLGAFACLGLSLAVVGIYAVISFLVTQRAQEIGVRMALGATRSSVLWLVVRQGLGVAIPGVALGAVGVLAAGKSLSGFLYGVGAFDPITLAGSAVALVLAALIASLIPARRAASIDPVRVLRAE